MKKKKGETGRHEIRQGEREREREREREKGLEYDNGKIEIEREGKRQS